MESNNHTSAASRNSQSSRRVALLACWSFSLLACSKAQSTSPLSEPMQAYTVGVGSIRSFSLAPNAELLLVRTASPTSGLGFSTVNVSTGEMMPVQDHGNVIEAASRTGVPSQQPTCWASDSSTAFVPFEVTTSDYRREVDVSAAGVSGARRTKHTSWLEIATTPHPYAARLPEVPQCDLETSTTRDYLDPTVSIRYIGPFALELTDSRSSTLITHLSYFGVRKLAAKHLSASPRKDLFGIIVAGERLFAWGPSASLIWRDGSHAPLELSGVVFPPIVWHPLRPEVFAVARNSKGTLEIRRWTYERAPS